MNLYKINIVFIRMTCLYQYGILTFNLIKIYSSGAIFFEHVSPIGKWPLIAEVHSEPSQTSNMEPSAKIVDRFCEKS